MILNVVYFGAAMYVNATLRWHGIVKTQSAIDQVRIANSLELLVV